MSEQYCYVRYGEGKIKLEPQGFLKLSNTVERKHLPAEVAALLANPAVNAVVVIGTDDGTPYWVRYSNLSQDAAKDSR